MGEGEIPYGYCHCGCGQKTKVAWRNDTGRGHVKGESIRFLRFHAAWQTGKVVNHGYVLVKLPAHERADSQGYVREHILIAEKALGKPLPMGAEIHHMDKDGTNNKPGNLVICQDHAYHHLLHVRMRAYEACGKAHYRKCQFCKTYDDPEIMEAQRHAGWIRAYAHHVCKSKAMQEYHLAHKRGGAHGPS
jgi:hypothetical protein